MAKLFAIGFFGVGVLAIGMMLLGMCEDPTAGPKIIVATPVPLTEEQQRVEGARSRGGTLFQYKIDVEGIALCNGQTRLANLSKSIKEIRLTTQEAANLCLCKWDAESGTYYSMQALPDTMPGDLLVWDADGLHDTKYTPR